MAIAMWQAAHLDTPWARARSRPDLCSLSTSSARPGTPGSLSMLLRSPMAIAMWRAKPSGPPKRGRRLG
eukprot:6399424-Pyramimonas_sp.AAC.1